MDFLVAGVPNPLHLCVSAVDIANAIQLEAPPINARLWLRRYISDLKLPEVSSLNFIFVVIVACLLSRLLMKANIPFLCRICTLLP